MDPDNDSAGSVVSEISSAISDVRESDALAESGDRTQAADRYLEAIAQLKGARQNTDGELGDVVDELLECANEHARMLIDERPVSEARDIGEIIDSIGSSEQSDTGGQAEGERSGMDSHDNKDRYGNVHRSDSSHSVGDSMPGTIGDSDGALHERLGEVPTVNKNTVSVPGQQEREETEEVETEDQTVDKMMNHL